MTAHPDTATKPFTVNEYESKTAPDALAVVMSFDFEHAQTIDLTIDEIVQVSSSQFFSSSYTIMSSPSSQLYNQMMQYDEKFIDSTSHDGHNQVNANHHRTQTKNQHQCKYQQASENWLEDERHAKNKKQTKKEKKKVIFATVQVSSDWSRFCFR